VFCRKKQDETPPARARTAISLVRLLKDLELGKVGEGSTKEIGLDSIFIQKK
jgi:hypothetical protein